MNDPRTWNEKQVKYLELMAEVFPSIQAASTEIINLQSILNLPKGTEHFMSDLHGEHEAFAHILNNCSGVIKDKAEEMFADSLSEDEISDLCTLIYYPRQKLDILTDAGGNTYEWYRSTLMNLIELSKRLSSNYTRSKVRKAMPKEFAYIIDELLHSKQDEDNIVYHDKIIDTVIQIKSADDFILSLSALIKRLAVDHLHIVGDIYDRGEHPDTIMDMLLDYHSLDIAWGNHDILWMGAAAGSEACIASVIRNNVSYGNLEMLESGYGISLRSLSLFAGLTYSSPDINTAVKRAISVLLFKLEGQIIMRHPEYDMTDRLLLDKLNWQDQTVTVGDMVYPINVFDFQTVDPDDPYTLTAEEEAVMDDLVFAFKNSDKLARHVSFMYSHGAMYQSRNQNLMFHGCVPLDAQGNLYEFNIDGTIYRGRSYLDYAEKIARQAYFGEFNQSNIDYMWYLWCGKKSPLSGRIVKTFERYFIDDKSSWVEPNDPYFTFANSDATCAMILRDFDLYSPSARIINGHTPVKVKDGETPVRANGKLLVIDGGFCKAYQKSTGIAGYTLIYDSYGMRLKSHMPFESVEKALSENIDIESTTLELEADRTLVMDTDNGAEIRERINDLTDLLNAYRAGIVIPED